MDSQSFDVKDSVKDVDNGFVKDYYNQGASKNGGKHGLYHYFWLKDNNKITIKH